MLRDQSNVWSIFVLNISKIRIKSRKEEQQQIVLLGTSESLIRTFILPFCY